MRIDASDVRKTYGDVTALDGLSLSIPSGSTFGILGTNGAGKSTLFRLLVGHDRPDAGTVAVGGSDVTEDGRRIRERVGYLPEHVGFPDGLTGREVLAVHSAIRGLPRDGRIARAVERVVVSRQQEHRHRHLPERLAGAHDRGPVDLVGLEHVAGDDHERGTVFGGQPPERADRVDARLTEARQRVRVEVGPAHAELPVGGVQEADHAGSRAVGVTGPASNQPRVTATP